MMLKMIIDYYIEYTNKYNKLYDKCVVLIKVGRFCKLYGLITSLHFDVNLPHRNFLNLKL